MDLDQQGQTLGYYGRKGNDLEKTEMLPKWRESEHGHYLG